MKRESKEVINRPSAPAPHLETEGSQGVASQRLNRKQKKTNTQDIEGGRNNPMRRKRGSKDKVPRKPRARSVVKKNRPTLYTNDTRPESITYVDTILRVPPEWTKKGGGKKDKEHRHHQAFTTRHAGTGREKRAARSGYFQENSHREMQIVGKGARRPRKSESL